MAVVGSWANLAEAQLLVRPMLVQGLVEEIIKEGGILSQLPVVEVSGTQLDYIRENVIPSGSYHAIADTWTASEDLDHTKITVTLAIHGDKKYIDDFVKRVYTSDNDMYAVVVQQTRKGLTQYIEGRLIYESAQFSGLHSLVTSAQTKNSGSGATGAAIGAAKFNAAIDLVRGGNGADVLLLPRQLALRIDLAGVGGSTSYPVLMTPITADGKLALAPMAASWRGIKIQRTDYMGIVETIASGAYSAETGGATGSIFACRYGKPQDGGLFLAVGSPLFEMVGPIESEDKNGQFIRIRSYLAPGIGSTKCLSLLDGNTDAALVA